jgi:hypothetical protein
MIAMALAAPALVTPAWAESRTPATLYKTPQCGCCEGYARYLSRNGFAVTEIATHDLPLIKKQHGVPEKLEGCHTTLVGNYVVEGHVPIRAVKKLLAERPSIRGISLPGMPEGSPGMTGQKAEPFTVYAITQDGGAETVFDVE